MSYYDMCSIHKGEKLGLLPVTTSLTWITLLFISCNTELESLPQKQFTDYERVPPNQRLRAT